MLLSSKYIMRGKTNSKRFPKTSFSLSTSTNTFSKNVVLHENVLNRQRHHSRHDGIMQSSRKYKNNDLYLVRGWDLVKTNLNTSASYLDTNSRVKCSMHSSPNIVTAHRVYPYTFIPPLAVTLQEYIDHAVCISLSRKSTSKGIVSRPLLQKYVWSTVEFNQIASPIPFQLQWTLKTSL